MYLHPSEHISRFQHLGFSQTHCLAVWNTSCLRSSGCRTLANLFFSISSLLPGFSSSYPEGFSATCTLPVFPSRCFCSYGTVPPPWHPRSGWNLQQIWSRPSVSCPIETSSYPLCCVGLFKGSSSFQISLFQISFFLGVLPARSPKSLMANLCWEVHFLLGKLSDLFMSNSPSIPRSGKNIVSLACVATILIHRKRWPTGFLKWVLQIIWSFWEQTPWNQQHTGKTIWMPPNLSTEEKVTAVCHWGSWQKGFCKFDPFVCLADFSWGKQADTTVAVLLCKTRVKHKHPVSHSGDLDHFIHPFVR